MTFTEKGTIRLIVLFAVLALACFRIANSLHAPPQETFWASVLLITGWVFVLLIIFCCAILNAGKEAEKELKDKNNVY